MKDRETWHAVVHEVARSWTQLSDRTIKQCPKKEIITLHVNSLNTALKSEIGKKTKI